jgi:hypothetical protein
MKDVAEKAIGVEASQRNFNSKLHFLRVKAHQEMVLSGKERTITLPKESFEQRMKRFKLPEIKPLERLGRQHKPGESRTYEFNRRSCYFDMESPTCPCCGEELDAAATAASVVLPLNRDDWKDVYSRPDLIHERTALAGIPAEKLRRTWGGKRGIQDIVWLFIPKDRTCYVVRMKDITGKGGLRPHAQVPIHLPYVPNEIYDLSGDKVGSFSEEQALGKIGHGPHVQPGQLQTVSYLENDQDLDEEYLNQFDCQEFNGPMQIA